MADSYYSLTDQYGQPIKRELLTTEIAGPTITGVRSPIAGYPGDGLNPVRLASILRDADQGNPLRFFELAETIEERDAHYAGILGTRKRSVAQLDVQVDAADDTPEAKTHAAWIEAGLNRDTLQAEIFDMLDAIGKGISFVEIVWDTSEGDWNIGQLIWRDPRWFEFDRKDGTTPLLLGGYDGAGVATLTNSMGRNPLPAFKFVTTVIRAKSGLPVRSGIARLAAWSWMFKAFTLRDWAIFAQTFGQPVRVGKYPAGSTEGDKDTLFRAVANIAGDCAAIIPASMEIDFVEAANVGASHALYKERADWLDQQMSKAVLGQTATTDAVVGGLGSGKEHRQVQEDIERADAKSLSAILNRDLVRPWVQLQFGPQKKYPRLKIGRPEEANVEQIVTGVQRLVPLGLQVETSWMRDLLGIPEPAPGAVLLTAPAATPMFGGGFGGPPALQSQPPVRTADDIAALAAEAEQLAQPAFNEIVGQIRTALQSANSFEDVRAHLKALKLKPDKMASALRLAFVMAQLSGRADIADAAT
jgi:phage gp29-like protein